MQVQEVWICTQTAAWGVRLRGCLPLRESSFPGCQIPERALLPKTATDGVEVPSSSFQKLPWPFLRMSFHLSGPSLLCWRFQPWALLLIRWVRRITPSRFPSAYWEGESEVSFPGSVSIAAMPAGPGLALPEVCSSRERGAIEHWALGQHELYFLGIKQKENSFVLMCWQNSECFSCRNVSSLLLELSVI